MELNTGKHFLCADFPPLAPSTLLSLALFVAVVLGGSGSNFAFVGHYMSSSFPKVVFFFQICFRNEWDECGAMWNLHSKIYFATSNSSDLSICITRAGGWLAIRARQEGG